MHDDYPRGITIEARLIGERRIDVLGLVGKITGIPWTRYYDNWADISQLTCNTLGQQGMAFRFEFCTLRAFTENDCVKSLI